MQLKPTAVSTVPLAYKMATHIPNYIEFLARNLLAFECKKKIFVELNILASVKVVGKCMIFSAVSQPASHNIFILYRVVHKKLHF
jgi:hypothetical protein